MTLTRTFHDINEAYHEMQMVRPHFSDREETRNGPAFVFREPVVITHTTPWRRVLFDPVRDANPFFHYMESIWMLAGMGDVYFPSYFATNIRNYSDDGHTIHGAYGRRWTSHFGVDQLEVVIDMLKKDPSTRRAVIAMWDPKADLDVDSRDLPCNTHIYFRVRMNELEMTVCNRSNDMVWGMLGANAVHFSILQEYVANAIGARMGCFHQFTNNLHIYEGFEKKFSSPIRWYSENPLFKTIRFSPYTLNRREAVDFVLEFDDIDYKDFFESPILEGNAKPMLMAWLAYKDKDYDLAIHNARGIVDGDWSAACIGWLERRRLRVSETQEG